MKVVNTSESSNLFTADNIEPEYENINPQEQRCFN